MRKFILLLIASIACSFTSYAQQVQEVGVDGIMLGMKLSDAIFYVGRQGDFKLTNKNNNWYEYENTAGIVYTLYFDSNKVINRIYKSDGGTVQSAMEARFYSAYADIIYKYGEPLFKSNSSLIWRGDNYKIELSFISSYNGYVNGYSVVQNYEIAE